MYVLGTAVMSQSKLYLMLYNQYESCLSIQTVTYVHIHLVRLNILYFGNFVNMQISTNLNNDIPTVRS